MKQIMKHRMLREQGTFVETDHVDRWLRSGLSELLALVMVQGQILYLDV